MTRLELHVKSWKDCTRCELHRGRKKVVIGRGSLPCDVLFVGEAPGKSEDVLGDPFVGKAGHRMNQIIEAAFQPLPPVTYALTNLVGCIPLGEDGNKTEEPECESIEACAPRLREFVEMASPKLIVCVGKLAGVWLNQAHLKNAWKIKSDKLFRTAQTTHPGANIPRAEIMHPSAIERANFAQQSLLTQRAVVALRTAAREYLL